MKNEVLIRMYVVLVIVVLLAVLLFAKAVKISHYEGDKWRKLGDVKYIKYEKETAERGNILSDDESLLATSLDYYKIHFDTKAAGLSDKIFENNVDSLAFCLSKYVNSSYTVGGMRKRLLDAKRKGARYWPIAKDVSHDQLEKIRKFPIFNRGRNGGGFIVESTPKRSMPFKLLAKRTIGYVREEANPVGIEGAFNEELQGEDGKKLTLRIRDNLRIPLNENAEIEPRDGQDVLTTLDINLQGITENSLLTALKHHDAQNGTAILMEVNTGAIKAIANLEKTSRGYFETYNFGVGEKIEPGSVFKLAPIMALLEEGKLDLDDKVPVYKGEREFYEEKMLDSSPQSYKLDSTTLQHAFEISSNVAIASQVYENYAGKNKEGGIRVKRMLNLFRKLNLYEPTNIEIQGEPKPYIKDPDSDKDNWSGLTLPWMSIGYEVEFTPLQLLNFYNTVANDGFEAKPHLVSEIRSEKGLVKKIEPQVSSRRIASEATIEKAHELLRGVVTNGTAKKLNTKNYKFSGKTGTAQINYKGRKKKEEMAYRSSFVGFFPSDAPKYSCIVVIKDPKQNGIYGADVAGPVFREIMDKIFYCKPEMHKPLNKYKKPQLMPERMPQYFAGHQGDIQMVLKKLGIPFKSETDSELMATVSIDQKELMITERPSGENLIPNVLGMGLKDALHILENMGLQVQISGAGKVKEQSIEPGTRIEGQKIKLVLA